jgi:predicted HTH domain antitoxin
MSQRTQLIDELKRALRERGITYAMAAKKLRLSEASVKRLFSTGHVSLARIETMCELAGIELTDLADRLRERQTPTKKLTAQQEHELVADPKLFLMTWLVINRWQYQDIVRQFRFTEREALRYLLQLDRLKIIELQPHNKVRLLVSRHFMWLPDGPVQNYIHQKMLSEFVEGNFSEPQADFFFNGGLVSEESLALMKKALQNCAHECALILDKDRGRNIKTGVSAAFLFALRPWEYSGFAEWSRSP